MVVPYLILVGVHVHAIFTLVFHIYIYMYLHLYKMPIYAIIIQRILNGIIYKTFRHYTSPFIKLISQFIKTNLKGKTKLLYFPQN